MKQRQTGLGAIAAIILGAVGPITFLVVNAIVEKKDQISPETAGWSAFGMAFAGMIVGSLIGMMLPFVRRLGYSVTPFDFAVPGVTSISVDLHKYGYAAKGASVILYRNAALRRHLAAAGIEAPTPFILAHSFDGYSTNVPVADLTGGKALVALAYEGRPIPPDHGGPARLLVPHLYFWKSAKWLSGLQFTQRDEPGFWELRGYHIYGDPWREQRFTGD